MTRRYACQRLHNGARVKIIINDNPLISLGVASTPPYPPWETETIKENLTKLWIIFMNSLPAYFPDGPAITRNDIVPLATEVTVYDDLSAFASRICSVANCGLKMAAPICHNLCKLANKFPLVLNLLATGVSLSIAFPSGASLPFFVATGMMVVGCQSGNITVNSE